MLANGSMSSAQSGEGEIRKNLVEAGLVGLYGGLAGSTLLLDPNPACLWFLTRDRKRLDEILFIDARKLGRMVDRTHRELTDEDIARIADTYHIWRNRASLQEETLPRTRSEGRPSPKLPFFRRERAEVKSKPFSLEGKG